MSEAVLKDGFIVIKIPVDVLDKDYIIPNDLMDDEFRPLVKVTDVDKFAKYFVNELNRESEDGSTMITEILDKAFLKAVDNGPEGLEEITYPEDTDED
jgi:hypothetical protein